MLYYLCSLYHLDSIDIIISYSSLFQQTFISKIKLGERVKVVPLIFRLISWDQIKRRFVREKSRKRGSFERLWFAWTLRLRDDIGALLEHRQRRCVLCCGKLLKTQVMNESRAEIEWHAVLRPQEQVQTPRTISLAQVQCQKIP